MSVVTYSDTLISWALSWSRDVARSESRRSLAADSSWMSKSSFFAFSSCCCSFVSSSKHLCSGHQHLGYMFDSHSTVCLPDWVCSFTCWIFRLDKSSSFCFSKASSFCLTVSLRLWISSCVNTTNNSLAVAISQADRAKLWIVVDILREICEQERVSPAVDKMLR